jgi:carboxymethylenebutenolidase
VETNVEIKTADGICDAAFIHPASGSHPGVLIWPDAFGLRPTMREMARRLAAEGYSVLVPNPFYRVAKAPVFETAANFNFGDPAQRATLTPLMGSINAPGAAERDATAFIAWMDSQPQVDRGKKVGTQGYCMGGPFAFRTAAAVPDRVGAVATFHGAGLVTNMPDSPHLEAAKSKAQFLVAIAENDDMRAPNDKNVLKETFAKANLPAEVEVYAGAAHGWCPPDTQVYNEAQAEKAWSRLLVLYGKALA